MTESWGKCWCSTVTPHLRPCRSQFACEFLSNELDLLTAVAVFDSLSSPFFSACSVETRAYQHQAKIYLWKSSAFFHLKHNQNLFKTVPWVASDPALSVLFIFDSGSSAAVSVCFLFFWTSRCGFACYGQQNQFVLTNAFSDKTIWTIQPWADFTCLPSLGISSSIVLALS